MACYIGRTVRNSSQSISWCWRTSSTSQVQPLNIGQTFCPHPRLFTAVSPQLCWAANNPKRGGYASDSNAASIFPSLRTEDKYSIKNLYSISHSLVCFTGKEGLEIERQEFIFQHFYFDIWSDSY